MGGRRPLKAGAPRLLGRHGGAQGRAYRRSYDAMAAEFDLASPLLRLEAGRVAAAWVNLEATTQALAAARRLRAEGRGRRPSPREIEKLSRRQGLADGSYAQALGQLRTLAARGAAPDVARLLADMRGERD